MCVPDSEGYEDNVVYVGNIGDNCSEELLGTLFSQVAPVASIKIIKEMGVIPYAFISYADRTGAASAIAAFNKCVVFGQQLKVHWATFRHQTPRRHISEHFHVYVGDLGPDITAESMRSAFEDFGEIADIKLMRDPETLRSKGYGFVSYMNKADAGKAIGMMNGQWLGSKAIKTGWGAKRTIDNQQAMSYQSVAKQSRASNRTVYCGGIGQGCSVELMRQYFQEYGHIESIKCFQEKGYAFIMFETRDAAVKAIVHRHASDILGYTARCAWGKDLSALMDTPNEAWSSSTCPANQNMSMPPTPKIPHGLPNKFYIGGGPEPGALSEDAILRPPSDVGIGPIQTMPSEGPLNGVRLNRRPVLGSLSGGYPTFETFRPRTGPTQSNNDPAPL